MANSTLSAEQILHIAAHWSCWQDEPSPSVLRAVPVPAELHRGLCLVLQGVRRCGKSTLMQQLVGRYSLDRRLCLFLNFEDPRLSGHLDHETLQLAVDAFAARHERGAGLVFFFDEIQWVDGWERWLRSQLDMSRHRFVITGSNANLLSGELGTVLTGRHLDVEVAPFSLSEAKRLRPEMDVAEYLHAGGFPAPLTMDSDADQLLRTYFSDIVTRDVRARVSARDGRPVMQVAQMAFESAGSELSYRRVAAAAGIAVETARDYLRGCEAAHLLYRCSYFAWSQRKRSARNPKYYPVDPGLRRTVVIRGGDDRGKALECAVFLALRRKFGEVCYWRGGGPGHGEVDFVVQDDGRPIPVQVTWDSLQPRHERALTMFYESFPMAGEAMVVTAASFEELDASSMPAMHR